MCLYSLGIPSYQLTFPPITYPPTAPYASLTHHLKKLVKEGKLCRYIVKALLYPQWISKTDTSNVVLRKRRKNSLSISRSHSGRSDSIEKQNTSKKNTNNDVDIEELDDSDDDCSSCASSSFGFIRFKTGKVSNAESTDYETFIDYGPDDNQPDNDDRKSSIKSSVLIDRDSGGSFIFSNQYQSHEPDARDSLPIYSKPLKAAIPKMPSRDSMVHTSIARLKIGLKPQTSETSETSEFEKRITGAHMGFENLANLADSTRIKFPVESRPTIEERHSMPTLFVGNRFNSSTTTEVYIPSYNDKQGVKPSIDSSNRSSAGSRDSRDSLSTTTHSSSIDLPAIVPATDQITAELLYNFNSKNDDDIIKPPSMFDNSRRISLNREISPFNKHQLNSDKKISSKMKDDRKSASSERKIKDPKKRCISYQFVKLKYEPKTDGLLDFPNKCVCCQSSQCPSARSSDSGVEGSCTISSPDPPKDKGDQQDEADFMDSISATGLRHSRSSHNFGRFDVLDFNDNHDSGQYGDNSLTKEDREQHLSYSPIEDVVKLSTSRETVKRKTRSQSAERSLEHDDQKDLFVDISHNVRGAVYKTGLYAHWWKKENLPKAMLRDLIVLKYNRERDHRVGNQRHIGWGSDVRSRIGEQSTEQFINSTINSTTQTQPIIQSSSQLQSVSSQQSSKLQQQQQTSKSNSDPRENRPTGARKKDRQQYKS